MVITDKFVYIHKPKTGGSFVTDALVKLYDGKWNRLSHARLAIFKTVSFSNQLGKLSLTANKHGGCLDIPSKHLHKQVVSTIRNPYDYYVSQYEFGWWKRKEWQRYYNQIDGFASRFPTFPDLNFMQFMELMPFAFNPEPHREFKDPQALGRNTVEIINDCFYKPAEILQKLNREFISSGSYKSEMFPVHFIFTHELNKGLFSFLLQQGYPEKNIEFILKKEKVLPQGKGRSKDQKWEQYYTPELKELVRKKDWLLFELFPVFDV